MNIAILTIIMLMLASCGLTVAGVYILYGLGWSLLSGAACSFLAAGFLRKGMNSG